MLEVLDCAHDNLESSKAEEKRGIVEGDGNETSDSSSDDDDDSSVEGDDDEKPNNKTNMIDDLRAYGHERKQKHRMHRGAMQYKVSLSEPHPERPKGSLNTHFYADASNRQMGVGQGTSCRVEDLRHLPTSYKGAWYRNGGVIGRSDLHYTDCL